MARRLLRIVALLVMGLLVCEQAGAAVLWFSGAETGDGHEFNTFAAAHSVQAITVHTGAYAVKCPAGNGAEDVWIAGLNLATVYMRAWLYVANLSTPASTEDAAWLTPYDQTTNPIAHVLIRHNTDGSYQLFGVNDIGATNTSAIALTANTWTLVEFKVTVSATVGVVEMRVGGVGGTTVTLTGQNTGTSNVGGLHSAGNNTGVASYDTYWDDGMGRDDAYPGTGQSIARQGKTGTPTYNNWTLNSCTGGVISGCWSNTPFTTTSNAISTASNAQTMLSGDLGAGTNPIGSSDTINACKTAMIAKIGSGTVRTYAIRRRLNAADTDTTKTLTTSDAYYDDGIWTDTLAHLQSSEIGGVRSGTGSGAQYQIEDMWLMCDYTPAAVGAYAPTLPLLGLGPGQ